MKRITIKNRIRTVEPFECGEGCKTLVIASVGTSGPADEIPVEMEKALLAQDAGAHAVTDHSFYGDLEHFHSTLVEHSPLIVSTVVNYEFAARWHGRKFTNESGAEAIKVIKRQAERGVDLMTVHSSLLKKDLELLATTPRLIPMTSKGGGIVTRYIRDTGMENPYYSNFDEILSICREHSVTLSLGTSFRPASVCDHWDELTNTEVERMGELVQRAISAGVSVMIEGIGHAAIDEIPKYIERSKAICAGVPYRVLPMATDIALGLDHISGAIASAVAVAAGADAITCIGRAEHIGLPTPEDLREAVLATTVACHCGELVKLRDYSRDEQMSRTRWLQGCKGDWTSAINPKVAESALQSHNRLDDQLIQCGMCGEFCGIVSGLSAERFAKRTSSAINVIQG